MNAQTEVLDASPALEAATITTSITKVQGEIAAFDKIAAGIAALELQHPQNLVVDVSTTAGMKAAVAARAAWRDPRIAVEKARKAAKSPVLDLGKQIDAFAAGLESQLREGEDNYDSQIKAEEARKEAEKAAKAKAEAERVQAHQERIAEIRGAVAAASNAPSALIAQHIDDVECLPVDASLEEFQGQAQLAKDETLDKLREMHAAAVAHEAEQARIKAEQEAEAARIAAERAEVEKLRAEAAERERVAAAERAAAERAQAEELARQREAQEAELKAQREAQERELAAQRAAQAEADAKAAAERKSLDDEAAARLQEIAAKQEADRAAEREAKAAQEAALNRIERAGPQMLGALKAVRSSSAWSAIEEDVKETVERAIEEATGQPA